MARAPDGLWQPFDRTAIQKLIDDGKVVLIDITADWCVTCQVNKALVLDRPPVVEKLAQQDTVAMKADWTRPSDRIAAYLASFGRYGIPFNAVYGRGAPQGIALPELLTSGAVLDALEKARGHGDLAGSDSPIRAIRADPTATMDLSP